MTDEALKEVLSRLDRMEERLSDLEARMAQAPPRMPAAAMPAPPPLANQLTYGSYAPPRTAPVFFRAREEVAEPSESPDERTARLEYFIATKIGLKLGAASACVGITYLISIGVQRGFITPWMLFLGCGLLCLALVVVGLRLRDEKEEFGQILVGIGSCGGYLTFAGGHVFQHLYSPEVLVGLFYSLSMLNLGFATWKASRPFFIIGLVGGLSAALMPLHDHNVSLNLTLHFLIVLPALVIVLYRKWPDMAAALFASASVALLPAMLEPAGHSWRMVVCTFDATALLTMLAYGRNFQESPFDPNGLGIAAGLFGAGCVTLIYRGGEDAVRHLAIFTAAGIALSLLLKDRAIRNVYACGALSVGMVLAPMGFDSYHAVLAYGVLATLCGIVGSVRPTAWIPCFAAVETVLAFSAYLCYLAIVEPRRLASAGILSNLLAGISLSSLLATIAFVRGYRTRALVCGTLGAVATSMLLGLAIGSRIEMRSGGFGELLAGAEGLALSALILSWLEFSKKLQAFVRPYAPGCALLAAMVSYLAALDAGGVHRVQDLEVVLVMSVAAISTLISLVRRGERDRIAMGTFVGYAWVCATRLAVLALPFSEASTSVSLGWITIAAVLVSVGLAAKIIEFRFGAFTIFAATAAKVVLVDLADVDAAMKATVLLLLGLVTLAGGYGYIRIKAKGLNEKL